MGSVNKASSTAGTHRKLDDLRYLLSSDSAPQIFCVTESKLNAKISNEELHIDEYNIFRADRNRKGGGVLIYCHNSLKPRRIDIEIKSIEFICIKITPAYGRQLHVCCIYRPPKSPTNWIGIFYSLVNILASDSAPCIITGDFNINLLSDYQFADDLKNTFGLIQHVTEATRITAKTATLLDHIYTLGLSDVSAIAKELHIADHRAVIGTIKAHQTGSASNSQQHKMCTFRSMKNLDQDALADDLTTVPWEEALSSSANVDDMVQVFNEHYLGVWNRHAPVITRRLRKRPTPWMNSDVLDLLHQRNAAHKTFLRSRSNSEASSDAYNNYRLTRAAATKAVRRAKREFFIRGARSGSKFFWRHIKHSSGFGKSKASIQPWPCHNNTAAKSSANLVNNKFVDSVDNLVKPIHVKCPTVTADRSKACFRLSPVTATDVQNVVATMKNTPAVGSDSVSLSMLRKSPVAVLKALTMIFNASITAGYFPSAWKHSHVTPVYKKGDVNDPNNYRPISLLPIISKVFERLINEQLRDFLESNGIINDSQHGFRRKRSCESALISLSKRLFLLRESKCFTCVTAIDFTRAFDTVNHDILLAHIGNICDATTTAWFRTYLCGRHQSVKYSNTLSDSRSLNSGTPQGSVLAPTLFVLYINDLLNTFPPGSVMAYADDVTIVTSGSSQAEVISRAEDALAQVQCWADDNGLVINPSKCTAMIVSPQVKKSSPITVDLRLGKGGAHITTARELRLLGVIFTFDLNWTAHADNTRKSINKMVGVINRLGNALNTNTRQRILQAFVMPKLTYCLPVWGRLCSKSNTAMDHTLLRAARVVLHNRTAELNKATFLSTDILPFSELATMRCLLAVHRILSDDDNSSYVPPLLARSGSQIITRNTTGRRFSIPKHRLTATEHCFYYNSSTIWNDLPLNVTTILGRNAFRTNLCNYILSKL